MCMIDDCEPWTVFRDETRRAAKEHRCDECRRTIGKGESYHFATGLFDGYWSTMRQCEHCHEAARWLAVACSGWLYEAIEDDLGNHVTGDESELRTAPLTRLYRWMRADWKDRSGNLRPLDSVKAVTDDAIARYREQYAAATS